MFYDLNVPYAPHDPEISNTLAFLAELGYTTVGLSQSFSGKLPTDPSPPPPPASVPKSLKLLTRVTVTLSDTSQNARIGSLTQLYSLVAIRPVNEKTLSQACTNLDCDIISLDLSVRLPFHFRFSTLSAAIARGIRFEICYGPGITGSGVDARRNLIGNATSLIRAVRGRGIVISSEAQRALGVRAPWDVVNLACVWGLSQERGKEAVCEEARKVVALAGMKRRSYRGVIDIVHGGDKEAFEQDKQQKGQKGKQKSASGNAPVVPVANNSKRKATNETEGGVDGEPPISKREMKRRAKRARLEASESSTGTTNSPKPQ